MKKKKISRLSSQAQVTFSNYTVDELDKAQLS